MAEENQVSILKSLKLRRAFFPILIGLGVVVWMFVKEFNPDVFASIRFGWKAALWIGVALIMMALRDLGYMVRIRVLSDNDLSWKQSFNVIMLWEFTSAVTPSAIGGTSVAIFYVSKEGLSVGRSSAIVMATSFLDELYFIIMFPLVFFAVSGSSLFLIGEETGDIYSFTNEFFYFAVVGYGLKLLYTLFVSYGLFINPRGLKWLLLWIFKLPILRKWRKEANKTGTDIVRSSSQLKSKPFSFWFKAFVATFFSWSARYWVVNCLLLAFFFVDDHFLVFARQLVMWIMMLVSPTPGGSGFAEFVFTRYLGDFIPLGFAGPMALLWRMASYYPYLVVGAIVLPRWIKRKFGVKKRRMPI